MLRQTIAGLLLAMLASPLLAADKPLLDADAVSRMKPAEQVELKAADNGAVDVTVNPGKDPYPGLDYKPAGGEVWDLSAYGHVELTVANTGAKAVSVALRVDQKGDWRDNPWNTESTNIKPGATGKVTVIFGYQYGHKPGFKLDPSKVANLKVFATKSADVQNFRIVSIVAGGEAGEAPAVDPNSIRIVPVGGKLIGPGIKLDAKQLKENNADVALDGDAVKVTFAAKSKPDAAGKIGPPQGRWKLTDYLQINVKVKNDGKAAVTPKLRAESNLGPTDWTTGESLAPGASADLVIKWGGKAWDGNAEKDKSGNRFESNNVSAITVAAAGGEGERVLTVVSATAVMPPPPALPEWLGNKPPVDGDWTQTVNENFDGDAINLHMWNVHAANYWDKATHFSKDNVLVGGGFAKLHFEKKPGFHNDDPGTEEKPGKKTNYACGFMDSYGKWTQRYGYFEARLKAPTAPGLWPAFWMMPDRGIAAGEQWKRSDTKNGGMEFDAFEHLTRWGPTRYNIAFHYDGYQKEHKSIGSTAAYVQPDKGGFVTIGILWTPGSCTFYGNGQVVGKWETDRICSVPMFPIFNIVTGGWDNDAVDDSKLPADMTIDYFRVWQRKDLASDVDGPKPNDGDLKAPTK